MTNTLINIAGKIDRVSVAIYQAVGEAATEAGSRFMVIGAAARDILMHHAYGAEIERATTDIDFGIQVEDWDSFQSLSDELIKRGFTPSNVAHRLMSPDDIRVDVVPFGGVATDNVHIHWPPNGDQRMSVLGFQEAFDHAEDVCISDQPSVVIPVATPQGIALLKLVAWSDREPELRRKDAKDIAYLLANYEVIPSVREHLFGAAELMEPHGWDITLAASFLLGQRTGGILSGPSWDLIESIRNEEVGKLHFDILVEEMCVQPDVEFERNEQIFSAFLDGVLSVRD